ncbi:Hypothetical protein SMAX5B_007687 [Scophthalmus maximus]|uniref:Uncharacterized protein n=1 Tax=Scophthalmus maximus TaxID=52904 RepID=A0A2U9B1P9_SCOMX|nr:Hypothetical protein SMAX5B_007687 [Scophthalmus maximus]KAF0029320.1 hypothetical protein F2P81_018425 [Scophthalmus maximus]
MDPERFYDALVQFGKAPITAMVNLQWKREVLEKHNAERSASQLRRTQQQRTQEGKRLPHPKRSKARVRPSEPWLKGVQWKRPVCMQKRREDDGVAVQGTRRRKAMVSETKRT